MMVDTTIDAGNVYITDGTTNGTTITTTGSQIVIKIDPTTKIDYNLDNSVIPIPNPVSGGNRGTVNPFTRIIDLKKIAEVISVQGTLSNNANRRGITERDNLITLMKNRGELTVVWGQGNYQTLFKKPGASDDVTLRGMAIVKLSFTEFAGIVGSSFTGDAPPERQMDVQVQLIRGKDMVAQ